MATATVEAAAHRLATLLTSGGGPVRDPTSTLLEFEVDIAPRPLLRGVPRGDVWAVDGGQALVADARCLQLVVTRTGRVRFRDGRCVVEDEGELRAHLLGAGDGAAFGGEVAGALADDVRVDINLLRDVGEWEAVARCVDEADAGAVVLLDGDLQPDARIAPAFVDGLLQRASSASVVVAAVTKHSSLSRGRAPLLGQLEIEASASLGPRSMWWTPVARIRDGDGAPVQVVAARLDPDARFAFRVDLPLGVDAEVALAGLAGLCDDAAFPGYPYPLTVADRLASCPSWVRAETWLEVDAHLDRAAVPLEVRERAFADRHELMERY